MVGDLTGLAALAVVGSSLGARLRHEALICLTLIGVVLLLDPQWPLQVAGPLWWALFAVGPATYLAVRRTICD